MRWLVAAPLALVLLLASCSGAAVGLEGRGRGGVASAPRDAREDAGEAAGRPGVPFALTPTVAGGGRIGPETDEGTAVGRDVDSPSAPLLPPPRPAPALVAEAFAAARAAAAAAGRLGALVSAPLASARGAAGSLLGLLGLTTLRPPDLLLATVVPRWPDGREASAASVVMGRPELERGAREGQFSIRGPVYSADEGGRAGARTASRPWVLGAWGSLEPAPRFGGGARRGALEGPAGRRGLEREAGREPEGSRLPGAGESSASGNARRASGDPALAGGEERPWSGGEQNDPLTPASFSTLTADVPWWLSWMLDVEEMRERAKGLNGTVARGLAALVSITYCDSGNIQAWNCTRCHGGGGGRAARAEAEGGGGGMARALGEDRPAKRGTPGPPVPAATLTAASFELGKVVWDPEWDLLGMVGWSPSLGGVVVAFRGTDSRSLHNWVENMRTWRTDLNLTLEGAPSNAFVHGGFYASYNASGLAKAVTKAVREGLAEHPGAPVYATGHSLGAALATICALDLRRVVGLPDVRLYTFGSPRVGNAIFSAWLQAVVPEHWRFTHNRDIVPSVAPPYMGFYHLAREVWINDYAVTNTTLVGFCDGSGEDMHCHNSQCHLGLCASIADHLLYLSEMYTPHPAGC